MYKLMEMPELIADSPESYARLAVRVATDKAWQAGLRQRILARNAVLFDNPAWSQALLRFCRQLVAD